MKNIDLSMINKLSKNVCDFFLDNIQGRETGRFDFEDGIYINIEEYRTSDRENRKYEVHKKYYDYQYIIYGRETIETKEKQGDECSMPYDEKRDIAFYNNTIPGKKNILMAGQGLIIPTDILHMPCLNINGNSEYVKKAVVKIPRELIERVL